jgi:transmembrane sensor
MSQERFWILLSAKLAGEATPADIRELESLIEAHPEWQYAIQNLEDIWKHQPVVDKMQEEDAYMLLVNRIAEQKIPFNNLTAVPPASRTFFIKRYWYYAAAMVAVLALAGFYYLLSNRPSPANEMTAQANEISTRRGSKSKVQLPDGTIVLLNAGSKLTYDNHFGIAVREVFLSGEGYFDVKRMPEKPFIIHTSSINIKVLGTVFNVRAYPEDKLTETSLIHGSIEVTMRDRPKDKIILAPSEKLVLENNGVINTSEVDRKKAVLPNAVSSDVVMSVKKLSYNLFDSAVAETQWIDNKLVFRDESFEALAIRMERWYDVDINIKNVALRQKRFSGIFEKESISEALEALQLSVSFKFDQEGNKFIIHN